MAQAVINYFERLLIISKLLWKSIQHFDIKALPRLILCYLSKLLSDCRWLWYDLDCLRSHARSWLALLPMMRSWCNWLRIVAASKLINLAATLIQSNLVLSRRFLCNLRQYLILLRECCALLGGTTTVLKYLVASRPRVCSISWVDALQRLIVEY